MSTTQAEDQQGQCMVNIEDLPQVEDLYKFVGIREDLVFAAECFDRLVQLPEGGNDDDAQWVERQAYFSAAAIAYSRCFGTGVRGKLEKSALDHVPQDEPGAARKVHQFICDMRDKHIAHSVSPFEAVTVGGFLFEEPGEDGRLSGAAWMVMRGLPLGVEAFRACRELARCLVNYLNTEIQAVQGQIGRTLQEEDAQAFAARPVIEYTVPGVEQAGVPRRFGRGIAP